MQDTTLPDPSCSVCGGLGRAQASRRAGASAARGEYGVKEWLMDCGLRIGSCELRVASCELDNRAVHERVEVGGGSVGRETDG